MIFNKTLVCVLIAACVATMAAAKDAGRSFSDQDLLALAGNKYASGELPLGDGHYVLDAPRKGYIYLCRKFGDEGAGGAGRDGSWIHDQTWNLHEKLSVQGQVVWNNAVFSNTVSANERMIAGNGLPINHATGIFPIQPNDPAYAVDRNPNSIRQQTVQETLPVNPVYIDPPFCMGMEVGYMLTGVPIFNGFDAGLRDAAAHEVQDSCQGHPQNRGSYHYHSLSSCIHDASEKTVIGYALDGFPITGPTVAAGKYLTTDNLDECHGITSEIIEDGQKKMTYHYVMTEDFPYSVSCFRAKPVRTGPPAQEGRQQQGNQQSQMQGDGQRNGSMDGQMGRPPQPPAEALSACSGKADGAECGFVSPRGDMIAGACHTPPQQSALACVPSRGH